MRLIFWVTALAVLSSAHAKNATAKTKPKRQLDSIRSPHNLQYSLVLPHSRVAQFRSLSSTRRISNVVPKEGKLPPYAVQMEPVVQYSQKDPLYDPNLENIDDSTVNKNEIYAQPKIINVHDQYEQAEARYEPGYGSLPTAPLYSHEPHPHYYEAPEPIIEIIIKESNESLPAPPPVAIPKKKKEPVQVYYVKYSKDPHTKGKVIYDKPIPAITPPSNDEEDDHHEEYVTVTPEPYVPLQTTTLRALIKPESELYHSDNGVKITFGSESHHHYNSDRREGNGPSEDHEETAPRPAIAFPNPQSNFERSASPRPQYYESESRPKNPAPTGQNYRAVPHQAQSRIQFQQPFLSGEPQLPRQGPSLTPFRGQPQINRQNPFGPAPSLNPSPQPNFLNGPPGPVSHFNNAPTIPGPVGPTFPTAFPRPNNGPTFHPRPNNPPPFAPRPHFNGPPRTSFHSGPQRPFQQPQQFFDEPKYLQENYHTITTEQVDPPKDQPLPNRPIQNFNLIKPSPSSPTPQFQDHHSRPQIIPINQQLPQQRPPQHFNDAGQNRPPFPIASNRPPFFNLKPSPPQVENNHVPFHQPPQPHPQQPHPQPPFSFHQGPPASRPSPQQHFQSESLLTGHGSQSPSAIPQTQFLPQPSSQPFFNFQSQPSAPPDQQFRPQHFPSERSPLQQPHGPSERPHLNVQSNLQDQANRQHQQNVGQFVPNGGELIAAIPKYEQHITVSGPSPPNYSGFSEPNSSPTASPPQYHHQQQQQNQQQQQKKNQQQQQQQSQQEYNQYEAEQEQVRQQLAQNVRKQQEEIQRLQAQLVIAQQQQQHQQQQRQQHSQQYEQNTQSRNNYNQQVQATSPRSQYVQERGRPTYATSTASPPYYQSTSRTVEIRPTTQKYVSSTLNSISTTPETKKIEKKKKPAIELPDEVPDDLRQQLLSSGILDNADISILDYDKVGDTPLESLPPDQLANFFSAGGAQQIAASENRPIIVTPNGEQIESRIDDDLEDQEIAASENVPSYVAAPTTEKKPAVEMKVVHFDPKTAEGQKLAKDYVKNDATQIDPVALNDKKYNRYLPLKVSGNQFPLPDILKGRKVTSVVVLAPVETEALSSEHSRKERSASSSLKGIKFVAGESLQDVLKRPTKENFARWLDVEKKTDSDLQSVVLIVTGDESAAGREIFMYDISSGNVNKLNGELSNAFVEAAENNSLSKDIEKLAIEGEGIPEKFNKEEDDKVAEGSENVPFLVDLSGLDIDQENSNQVSISSGYSKTKHGRSLRRH